jgi:hypothetical protein
MIYIFRKGGSKWLIRRVRLATWTRRANPAYPTTSWGRIPERDALKNQPPRAERTADTDIGCTVLHNRKTE